MKLPLKAVRSIRFQRHPTMTACWIWTGSIKDGVGYCHMDGQNYTARQAVYRCLIGAPPEGNLVVACGERLCVNPHHIKRKK